MPKPTEPPSDEPLLFDLPLEVPERRRAAEPPPEPRRPRPAVAPAPVEAPRPVAVKAAPPVQEMDEEEAAGDLPAGEHGVGIGSRFASGGADLVVHAAVTVILLIGIRLMNVRAELSDWPAFALFLLAFSFLYMVVPLAFWGHTLGMAWSGLVARNRDGEPLTFDQTARRWLGSLLSAGTLGLPLLLTGEGRSLTDRISGSATYRG